MPYQFATEQDRQEMLAAIGVSSVEDLFETIPADMRLGRPLELPPAMGELELSQHISELVGRNLAAGEAPCFLGGGCYDHFIPAAVDHIAARGEWYTSYTPYQPEVSQGNLQAMFEYQTLICRLTGMDVSNASLYDGGSATAEAVLMAMSATKRLGKVVVAGGLHPEFRQILKTYLAGYGTKLVTLPVADGGADLEDVKGSLDGGTACLVIQNPNFFGCVVDVAALSAAAREVGALSVVVFDPISVGVLKRPGDMGADIVVGEGQSLGSPMAYGGPYLGILACREQFIRRLPGRIAGQTVDRRGKRCFTLTLQTREQHIRREKATSNICTNQTLFALRATIYLSLLGPMGIRRVAELSLQKARYLAERLTELDRFEPAFGLPTFKEFVIRDREQDVDGLLAHALSHGYLAGIPLRRWYPDFADCLLIAVTEKRTRAQLDGLVELFRNQSGHRSDVPQRDMSLKQQKALEPARA